jgi:hypothetical protein
MVLMYYLDTYDGIFGMFLRNKDPQNLEEAQATTIKLERNFLASYKFPPIHVPDQPLKVTPFNDLQPSVVTRAQEFLVIEEEPQLAPYQVPGDEQDDDGSGLNDQEPVAAPLESYAEFHEDEGEELSVQECSLVHSSDDDKFQEEEPQVNHVEINQQETSSLHIPTVVQEQFDQLPLQQGEQLLVQPEDDTPYILPMIPHSDFVLQEDPLTDQCLDIRVHHDPVELRMMEVFQQVDSKSFGSHAFMLIIVEVPCSKFQPIAFSYSFSSKYIKASFRLMRFHDGMHWRIDCVDLSHLIDHLVAWLHWSFEYVD